MPKLILVRHGNTFEASDTPTYVGSRTDLPLTQAGEQQGQAFADMASRLFIPIDGIITGPLLRTRRFAEILGKKVNNVFTVDERLSEIDYGLWENKTTEEVKLLFGDKIVEDWDNDGAWPEGMHWAPSQDKLAHNVESFLKEQHKKLSAPTASCRVAITSNGILRFVHTAVTGKKPDKTTKVKTGHYCVLSPTASGWVIEQWNQKAT